MQRNLLMSLLLLLTAGGTTPALAGGPIWTFDQFQQAESYAEARAFLTASYRESLESRLSREQLTAEFDRDRLQSYAAQVRGLGNDRVLLIASNITFSSPHWQQLRDDERNAIRFGYEFVQQDGKWLIDRRFDPNTIILDLLEKQAAPAQFASNSLFAMGQQVLMTRGAFAYWFNENTIWVDFYPAPLSREDLELLAYGRRAQAAERTTPRGDVESKADFSPPEPRVSVAVTVDANRRPTAWTLAHANFAKEGVISESVSQMSPEQLTEIAVEGRRLRLNGDGTLPGETVSPAESEQPPSLLWRLDLDLEVFARGL